MISAYAILKKGAANANHAGKRLDDKRHKLIVQVCDEILAGQHQDMFPLHVWMTGSGTQFNMNVNEVISNRCCQIAGTPLGSKARFIRMITSTWHSRRTTRFHQQCASPRRSM
jgi:fumarate hydratase class II